MSRFGRPKHSEARPQLSGAWFDVGNGVCQRCGGERRLYSPEADPAMAVCAPCSQVKATSSIPNIASVDEATVEEDA
jgi:hypothetical protein